MTESNLRAELEALCDHWETELYAPHVPMSLLRNLLAKYPETPPTSAVVTTVEELSREFFGMLYGDEYSDEHEGSRQWSAAQEMARYAATVLTPAPAPRGSLREAIQFPPAEEWDTVPDDDMDSVSERFHEFTGASWSITGSGIGLGRSGESGTFVEVSCGEWLVRELDGTFTVLTTPAEKGGA